MKKNKEMTRGKRDKTKGTKRSIMNAVKIEDGDRGNQLTALQVCEKERWEKLEIVRKSMI